jgi:hypothetical protein
MLYLFIVALRYLNFLNKNITEINQIKSWSFRLKKNQFQLKKKNKNKTKKALNQEVFLRIYIAKLSIKIPMFNKF